MNKRLFSIVSILLAATTSCYAHEYTLAEANIIIMILIIVVIALAVCGGFALYHNKVISQRNEQMQRILTVLNEYRELVGDETFCQLVPRYKEAGRTLDYINSLRAEYAAKLLMDRADYPAEDIARMCGFRDTAAYNSAFKFAFGITPTEYLTGMGGMFKKSVKG